MHWICHPAALVIVALAAHVSVFKLFAVGAIGALVCIPRFKMAPLQDVTLGIDFGTLQLGHVRAPGARRRRMISLRRRCIGSLPTALFFNAEEHRTHPLGGDVIAQYLKAPKAA